MRKPLRITLGVFLVMIGIVGWLIPIIPGWPALIPGLVILGEYYPPLRKVLERVKAKIEQTRAKSKASQNKTG